MADQWSWSPLPASGATSNHGGEQPTMLGMPHMIPRIDHERLSHYGVEPLTLCHIPKFPFQIVNRFQKKVKFSKGFRWFSFKMVLFECILNLK
jgi:hypothetical protein